MSEIKIKRYHPGKYIQQYIDDLGMSNKEFSFRSGISERTLSDLLSGKGNITFAIANNLASFFDTSINYWTNLQNDYDSYLSFLKIQDEINEDYDLLKGFKKYLIENGFIEKEDKKDVVVEKVRKVLSINRISSLNTNSFVVSYKEQKIIKNNDTFAQNFWVTYALTEARKKETPIFNKQLLLNNISALRTLTTKEPKMFVPELTRILTNCGVSFVLLPYLTKSNIYGVTKWLPNGKVMLAMSNRGNRADVFWFTFFHELAHVLLEHKRYFLLQGDNIEDTHADYLAANMLIGQTEWKRFVDKNHFDVNSIKAFAKQEQILPMIITGRLEKEQKIDYGHIYQYFYKTYDNLFAYNNLKKDV